MHEFYAFFHFFLHFFIHRNPEKSGRLPLQNPRSNGRKLVAACGCSVCHRSRGFFVSLPMLERVFFRSRLPDFPTYLTFKKSIKFIRRCFGKDIYSVFFYADLIINTGMHRKKVRSGKKHTDLHRGVLAFSHRKQSEDFA